PAHRELRRSRVFLRSRLRQERLLGKEVGRSCSWIELREFGVGNGRRETQEDRGENAKPHPLRCQRLAVRGLNEEREPQERAWRNQRHCIDGEPRETQC